MKKLFLFVILLFMPFLVLAEECDISKITITSMEQSNIEGNTEEIEDPTFQGRSINLNLKMYEVGDSITYNMTINNDSEEDYMIEEDTFKTDSDYIEYTLRTNDNTNVVKAGSTKEVTLIVTYKKEVDDNLLTNNKFDASNNLKLSLNTSEKEQPLDIITTDNIKESVAPQEVKNPLTSISSMLLISTILLTTIIIAYILIKRKTKYTKYLLILLSIILIPTVYAICKCDIEVESSIEIEKKQKLYDTVANLSKEENACVTKYEGEVTDEVGKTVNASNVYFDKCMDKRNVIFGGFCWQVIRTTETGGTKMIYNGEPVDGKCLSNREAHKGIVQRATITMPPTSSSYLFGNSFTYNLNDNTFTLSNTFTETWNDSTYEKLIGKYTCKSNNDTCESLYQISGFYTSLQANASEYKIYNTNYAHIGYGKFNINNFYPSMVGYMYNKVYKNVDNSIPTSGSLVGNDVSYSNGIYTLLPANGESTLGTTLDATHHYTCNNTTGTCNKVRYYYYSYSNNKKNYIELDGEANIEEAINNMLYVDNVNKYNSNIKGIIDAWYAQNLSDKTNMIEDTVYCNARNMTNQETNGWNKNGSMEELMYFKNHIFTKDLSCQKTTDQFAVSNNKAKLTYPIGLINHEEWYNIDNSLLRSVMGNYWSLSPDCLEVNSAYVRNVNAFGSLYTDDDDAGRGGFRPAISLANDDVIVGGNGTETDPWIIE